MSLKISKIFAIPLIFSSFLFDANNEFNNVNANVKNSPANKNDFTQLKVLSVANMLGEAIWRIHEESSVSSMFR